MRLTGRRFAEPANFMAPDALEGIPEGAVVTFRGPGAKFANLNGHHERLHAALRASARPRWKLAVDDWGEVPIAANVRLGNDFRTPRSSEDFARYSFVVEESLLGRQQRSKLRLPELTGSTRSSSMTRCFETNPRFENVAKCANSVTARLDRPTFVAYVAPRTEHGARVGRSSA